jgi:hypothetical protein
VESGRFQVGASSYIYKSTFTTSLVRAIFHICIYSRYYFKLATRNHARRCRAFPMLVLGQCRGRVLPVCGERERESNLCSFAACIKDCIHLSSLAYQIICEKIAVIVLGAKAELEYGAY